MNESAFRDSEKKTKWQQIIDFYLEKLTGLLIENALKIGVFRIKNYKIYLRFINRSKINSNRFIIR